MILIPIILAILYIALAVMLIGFVPIFLIAKHRLKKKLNNAPIRIEIKDTKVIRRIFNKPYNEGMDPVRERI